MSRLLCQAELLRRQAVDPSVAGPPTSSPFTESNRRPSPYHGDALPTELKGRALRAASNSTRHLSAPCRDPPRACERWGAAEGPHPSPPCKVGASLRTGPDSGADEQSAVGGTRGGGA